mgnify:CR=1 FL=1
MNAFIKSLIQNALMDDAYDKDITSNAIIDNKLETSGSIITHTPGILSGTELLIETYKLDEEKFDEILRNDLNKLKNKVNFSVIMDCVAFWIQRLWYSLILLLGSIYVCCNYEDCISLSFDSGILNHSKNSITNSSKNNKKCVKLTHFLLKAK